MKTGAIMDRAIKHLADSTDFWNIRNTRLIPILSYLKEIKARLPHWQAKGYIPSRGIEPRDETTHLHRERGWTHWHHLFTPRQLLMHGRLISFADSLELNQAVLCRGRS